jgi:hypothetical protein
VFFRTHRSDRVAVLYRVLNLADSLSDWVTGDAGDLAPKRLFEKLRVPRARNFLKITRYLFFDRTLGRLDKYRSCSICSFLG